MKENSTTRGSETSSSQTQTSTEKIDPEEKTAKTLPTRLIKSPTKKSCKTKPKVKKNPQYDLPLLQTPLQTKKKKSKNI